MATAYAHRYRSNDALLNEDLRWLAEGAKWALLDPSLFAERVIETSLEVFV